jgi:hypothetical protein
MLETVDRLIAKRLRLPSFARWRKQFQALRQAQRQPIHWGVEPENALVALLPRIEPDDNVLVIGAGVQGEACLLAALDAQVTFVDEDLGVVDQLEARITGESLAAQFMAYVAALGEWLPPLDRALDLAVLDAATLATLSPGRRRSLLLAVREQTRPGGVHVLLPGVGAAAPEGYLSHYPDWQREPVLPRRRGKAARSGGVVLVRPAETLPTSSQLGSA